MQGKLAKSNHELQLTKEEAEELIHKLQLAL
jgi:hypothetical protein